MKTLTAEQLYKTMAEQILEESEKLNGVVVQTVRRSDGTEYARECQYRCSICGLPSDRPFPVSAISCFRPDCREGERGTDRRLRGPLSGA